MTSSSEEKPATFLDRAHLLARATAVVVAAYPPTWYVPLPLTQLLTRRFEREDRLKGFHYMVGWARFSARQLLGIKLVIRGEELLPRPSRGHMYVSNHQSYTDIPVLMAALDTVAFLSKRVPVKFIPFIGRAAYCGGTVYLERSSKESREKALAETIRMCKESTAVVVFPEGTRSEDGNLREKIYPRAMHTAYERRVKVVPVGLHGTHRVVPKAMDRVRTGQPVTVVIGEHLDPRDHESETAFADASWSAVRELHEQARAEVESRR